MSECVGGPPLAEPSWVRPNGTTLALDGSQGIEVLEGVAGRWMPPVVITADPAIGQDGARVRQVRRGVREVSLPMAVKSDTLVEALRGLVRAFDPVRGEGRLRVGDRDLRCRYLEGLAIEEVQRPGVRDYQTVLVVLAAHDPLWYDAVETQLTFAVDSGEFFPLPPWEVRSTALATGATVTNSGDVEAFPVWQVRGPVDAPVVIGRGDDEFVYNRAIAAGEVVTFDTRPGIKTVVSSTEGDTYADLSAASVLWALDPGTNDVSISLPEAGDDARVVLRYRRRWLTP